MNINLSNEPIGVSSSGNEIFLKDLWPSSDEVNQIVENSLTTQMFKTRYEEIYKGDKNWQSIKSVSNKTYSWNSSSTYIKHPPFFSDEKIQIEDIVNARILAMLGDSVTTDHISPAGAIKPDSPAGKYLNERQIKLDQRLLKTGWLNILKKKKLKFIHAQLFYKELWVKK